MKQLIEGVFLQAAPLSLLGAEMGTRMTVLAVGDGVLVYSPVAIDDALANEIEAIGPVRWIVAPCLFHHLHANAAKGRWPDAQLLGVEGLTDKVSKLAPDAVLDASSVPAEWSGQVEPLFIGGMPKLNEVALLHRPSRTLVLADFMFNLTEGGWWTRTFLGMAGAFGGPRQSKLLRSMMKDRDAVRASRDALLDLDFDALSLCHGEPLPHGGKDALRAASEWLG